MKHSERFALNQWLSEYPDGLTYDAVLERIANDDGGVTPWLMVERYAPLTLIEIIDSTRVQVERMLDNLVYGIALADKTEEESKQEGAM